MPYKNPEKNREYHRQYDKKWNKENPDKRRAIQKRHDEKRGGTPKRIKQESEVRFRRHHRNKVKVLEIYGEKCAHCGEDRYEVLTVDHIHNDGATHRKSEEYKRLNCGGMWGFLARTPYRPDLYQILCCNCNHEKYYYPLEYKYGNKPFSEWKEVSKLRYKNE